MAGKPMYEYPPRDELIALLKKHGQYGVSKMIGCSRGALAHHLRKEGIEPSDYRQVKEWVPRDLKEEPEVSEEEILRQRVKELEKALRQDRKQDVIEERLARAIETSAASALPVYNARKWKPTTPKKGKKKAAKRPQHEMVLLWSDTHAGEVVSREETNGLNEYNWDIMWKRQEKIRESIYSYLDNRPYPIEKLHIIALGDMLSGNIHDELVATNEYPYTEVMAEFSVEGARWLADFGDRFREMSFTGVVGNHPRANRKPQAKSSYDNGDWLVYRYMRDLLRKNEQFVSWDIPKSSQTVKAICGRNIFCWHGDGVRSSMPGVPWGGVMRRSNALALNWIKQAGTAIDMFVCGHFHNGSFVNSDAGQVLINGSVKGVDEYSLKAFGGGRPAQQFLLTMHRGHGLTDLSMIDLQEEPNE